MRIGSATRRREAPHRVALLQDAYIHLTSRRHTTITLAAALGVSPATAFRVVKTLRAQGRRIVSMKEGDRWFFVVPDDDDRLWKDDPLIKARGFIRGVRWPRGKPLNDVIDDTLYGRP